MGGGHPESPARLSAIEDQIGAAGIESLLRYYDAPLVTREQLQRVHGVDHIEALFRMAPPPRSYVQVDPDTVMSAYTLEAARHAAGAGAQAVHLVLSGQEKVVFCCVRPPGHHATRNQAMGFCFFSNIAVAAAHALSVHRLTRVAILDFDVHHGNGTQGIFENDERVLFCYTFQHPYYPHVGNEPAADHIVNVPLAAGAGGEEFRRAVSDIWLPAVDRFQPELVLAPAGFDAHAEDEMAHLKLTDSDYTWVTAEIKSLAGRSANGRIDFVALQAPDTGVL